MLVDYRDSTAVLGVAVVGKQALQQVDRKVEGRQKAEDMHFDCTPSFLLLFVSFCGIWSASMWCICIARCDGAHV